MQMSQVYNYVSEKIVGMLDAGTIPWRKPWTGLMPQNYISKKEYRGINLFLLAHAPFKDPRFLTFKQVQGLGGKVKKGEKAWMVIFWKRFSKEETDKNTGETKKRSWGMLRYYNVFNVEQTEGWTPRPLTEEALKPNEKIAKCEEIVANLPEVPVMEGSQIAAYSPSRDTVMMPDIRQFESSEGYYCTLFHELTHWTGNEKRLGRFTKNDGGMFGSQSYSKEELVAEFGAAFLCAVAGTEQPILENAAAYIQGWKKRIKEDPKLLVQAAGKATAAANWLQKITYGEVTKDETGEKVEVEPVPVEAEA